MTAAIRDSFLQEVSGVIHVGANSGQERDTYKEHGLPVIWVEAFAEVFEKLLQNIDGYPSQRAILALMTDADGAEYEFNVANNSGASSSIYQFGQHKDIWPQVEYVSKRTLRGSRLDTLLHQEGISVEDYSALVLDVQGAELLVLKGAGKSLEKFRFVKAEAADFESYVGGCTVDGLNAYLSDFDFQEISRRPFAKHQSGGRYWDITWGRPNAKDAAIAGPL